VVRFAYAGVEALRDRFSSQLCLLAGALALLNLPAFGDVYERPGELTLNGSAQLITVHRHTFLELTKAQQNVTGTAFTTQRIFFGRGFRFKTFFQFQMANPGGICAADGMTFTIQADSPAALGGGGGGLGYTGIAPSVAIEFDTCDIGATYETNNNHVAILTEGQTNDQGSRSPYGVSNCDNPTGVFGCLGNGDVWSAWIDYDGVNLYVAVADNTAIRPFNLIVYPIDIRGLIGQDSAYIGFTAATGNGWESHSVFNWVFFPIP
jgi:Legume lectin domain